MSNNKTDDLQGRIDNLEVKNATLQSKLDEIDDIVTCTDPECSAEEHVSEIKDVIDGSRNGHYDD